eukprot:208963_1
MMEAKEYNNNALSFIDICSITPQQMLYRTQNGVKTFTKLIRQKSNGDTNILLRQTNWCVVVDTIWDNITHITLNEKFNLFNDTKEWLSKTLTKIFLLNYETRETIITYHFDDIVLAHPGYIQFIEALGFTKGIIHNAMVAINPDETIINVALQAVKNKLKVMNMVQTLSVLWNELMLLMSEHDQYKHQDILHRIVSFDFMANYNEYYFILTKFAAISATEINSRRHMIIQILIHIGFVVFYVEKDEKIKTIFDCIWKIYNTFNEIEIEKKKFNGKIFQKPKHIDDEDKKSNIYFDQKTWTDEIESIALTTQFRDQLVLFKFLKKMAKNLLIDEHHKTRHMHLNDVHILHHGIVKLNSYWVLQCLYNLGFVKMDQELVCLQVNYRAALAFFVALHRRISILNMGSDLYNNHVKLNNFWIKCIGLMNEHETFHQQSLILSALKAMDYLDDYDYDFLLKKMCEVNKMKIYSEHDLAAEILKSIGFTLPQIDDIDGKSILKCVVRMYKIVENTEKHKHNDKIKFIHIAEENKYDDDFKNNEDNVIGDFKPIDTPYSKNE